MPVDLVITPPPTLELRVEVTPRIQIAVSIGGGGGAGTLTEIENDGGLTVTDPTGPVVGLAIVRGTAHDETRHADDAAYTNARTPTAHKSTHATGGTDVIAPSDIGAVPTSRTISGTGISGGGDLSANRTLAIIRGTAVNETRHANDAAYTDARTPNGAAGGDLGGTYPDPTVAQARGLRETTGPTTLAMGAVADGQVLVRSGATVIGADNIAALNEYWCRDSTISYGSMTDEFTSGSLPTIKEWSTWSSPTNGGAIDSTTTPSASNYQATANARRSWLMVRPAPSGTGVDLAVMLNSFTYAAGGFQFRFRFTPGIINTGTTANGVSLIYITKNSSGNPDVNANVNVGFVNNNPQTYKVRDVIGGGSTDRASYTYAAAAHVAVHDHELILLGSGAVGTITVKAYMRGPTGTRYIGAGTINESVGNTLRIVWRVTSTDSDTNIYAMDYFREYPNLKITP